MHVSISDSDDRPRTQAARRARTRAALLEAGARGFSRYGYGNVVLEKVAGEAGYTRGALYHLFTGKEELALAVVDWVADTWEREVWEPAQLEDTPVDILVALARGHIVFCRRDIARVMMALRVEFDGREHPVGSKVADIGKDLATRFGAVISAGRRDGSIPARAAGEDARRGDHRRSRGSGDPPGRCPARRGDGRADGPRTAGCRRRLTTTST